MQLVNTALIKQPLNWLVVLLMLVFAGIAGHLLLNLAGFQPASTAE